MTWPNKLVHAASAHAIGNESLEAAWSTYFVLAGFGAVGTPRPTFSWNSLAFTNLR